MSDIKNYHDLDADYLSLDKTFVRRTKNIQLIPTAANRKGGKIAYAEWAHVVGIFQTLLHAHLNDTTAPTILDVGCGTGLLAIASQPFVQNTGRYIGIDVDSDAINFCNRHYREGNFEFLHLNTENAFYAPGQQKEQLAWPVVDETADMVTALSVWTHFTPRDAHFYFNEVSRVLKPGGKAIITFFVLDALYFDGVAARTDEAGTFHTLPQNRWIFDQVCRDSGEFFYPTWVDVPEQAIAVTNAGLQKLVQNASLTLLARHLGNWKEVPGLFFQDILVFQK
ncbi:MAG: class I SAM-dependent methyltransferase [Pseudomonadota bacterium]